MEVLSATGPGLLPYVPACSLSSYRVFPTSKTIEAMLCLKLFCTLPQIRVLHQLHFIDGVLTQPTQVVLHHTSSPPLAPASHLPPEKLRAQFAAASRNCTEFPGILALSDVLDGPAPCEHGRSPKLLADATCRH
jgi:hypothetical protein